MFIYIYDGSFAGLLTAIYEAYYRKEKPEEILSKNNYQPQLTARPIFINADEAKSTKVYHAIREKIGGYALQKVYYTFLSELPASDTLIYRYLKLGFRFGSKVNLLLTEGCVRSLLQIAKKVGAEQHRMLGFIRFSLIDHQFYYAALEPDYNIVGLIAPHFAARLKNECFIIHDLKRELAVFYNTSDWIIASLTKQQVQKLQNPVTDSTYQQLWKKYFQATTINTRLNTKCQTRSMPKRYWPHLPEMNESD